jgi:hypothetical protein
LAANSPVFQNRARPSSATLVEEVAIWRARQMIDDQGGGKRRVGIPQINHSLSF